MVRVTALAILAFAASALAAPQGPNNGSDQIFDFKGKPLTGEKKAKFLDLDTQGEAKLEQEKMEQELNSIHEEQDDLLGVPKGQ
ncbi:hypothetical protein J3459_019443 [Metarhizium acridum]|uniref:Uncharacterized protein n=1 Tax=Metarhizium acridum (strain CQMa 102) TaxID=655827 RepID=E9EAD1_METAQ|nr:uncharacterized protein MAC_06830 [Metarhizium acridum CQMa 102]EFY87152.1 hypothetical protein MAC_06830 [Metarhizium acridum CQMa 102]KAG8405979.1 hypothetical protein J3459_019443 [Metarhizium acridum]